MTKIITRSFVVAACVATVSLSEEAVLSDVEAQYSAKSAVVATDELKQTINLGFSNTTGNTETLNINGKYTMAFSTVGYNNEKLKVGFDASVFVNENNNVKSNEEYTANLGVEQYIFDGWLGYGAVNWLRNPDFKNLNNKFSVGAGIGKELYNDGKQSLKVKLGGAYNFQQYTDNAEDVQFASVNEYLEYVNTLNKTSALYIKIGAMQNVEDFQNDYEVLAVLGFNFSVAENIFVSIEEEVGYDKIHPGTEKATDTKSIVRVGYNF